jgi:hypothetical protein
MLKMNSLRKQLAKWLPFALLMLVLTGCGDDGDRKKKNKDTDRKSAPGLGLRFTQVHAQLDALEREAELQKKHIAAARAELQAIQNVLANTKLDDISAADLLTTGVAGVPAAERPAKVKQTEDEKDDATNRVFKTLAILLFLLFAVVYIGKLWRDREYAPATPESYTSTDAADAGGTYYKTPSPEPGSAPGDATPPTG